MGKVLASDIKVGDVLVGNTEVIGHADARGFTDRRSGDEFDPTRQVAYEVRYADGGTGVLAFDRDAEVRLASRTQE